jgi:hypothetical protein
MPKDPNAVALGRKGGLARSERKRIATSASLAKARIILAEQRKKTEKLPKLS